MSFTRFALLTARLPGRRLALASVGLGLSLGLLASAGASHIGEALESDQQTVSSGDQLLGALQQWQNAPAAVRAARLQQMLQLAEKRRERLLKLMQTHPEIAALRMLPVPLRTQFPAEARGLIEEEVALQGSVYAEVASDVERGFSQQRFFFQSQGGARYALQLAETADRERTLLGWSGRELRIKGTRLDGQLLLGSKADGELVALDGTVSSSGSVLTLTPKVSGDQKTLVILANFSDKALSCTAADVQSRLFGTSGTTTNVDYLQSSKALVSFSGRTAGPFTINYSSTGSCDYNGWASAADAAAKAAGIDLTLYKRINYVTPSNGSCGWSGLAYMPGTRSWVQSCGSTGVFVHELGHNLSFHHAGTPTSEYGDASDPMGGARMVQFNAANRVMAGWLPTGSVIQVTGSGGYSLSSLAAATPTTPQVLRLVKANTGEYYYVSLRQAVALDANLGTAYQNTLSIHRAGSTLPTKTYLMSNLAVGQTFSDSVNGIQITHQGLAAGISSVAVTIAGATCARSAPTVSISPATQKGAPGARLAYTVAVKNNNTTACGSSTFNLTQALPGGFTGAIATSSLALAAGASGSSSWSVNSPTTATVATYTLGATASESGVANSATQHASYVVYTDISAPTLTITSPSSSVSGPWATLSATASDASGVRSVSFYVDGVLLLSDTSAPYSTRWKTTKGLHTISVRAVDVLGYTVSKSLAVTVY